MAANVLQIEDYCKRFFSDIGFRDINTLNYSEIRQRAIRQGMIPDVPGFIQFGRIIQSSQLFKYLVSYESGDEEVKQELRTKIATKVRHSYLIGYSKKNFQCDGYVTGLIPKTCYEKMCLTNKDKEKLGNMILDSIFQDKTRAQAEFLRFYESLPRRAIFNADMHTQNSSLSREREGKEESPSPKEKEKDSLVIHPREKGIPHSSNHWTIKYSEDITFDLQQTEREDIPVRVDISRHSTRRVKEEKEEVSYGESYREMILQDKIAEKQQKMLDNTSPTSNLDSNFVKTIYNLNGIMMKDVETLEKRMKVKFIRTITGFPPQDILDYAEDLGYDVSNLEADEESCLKAAEMIYKKLFTSCGG